LTIVVAALGLPRVGEAKRWLRWGRSEERGWKMKQRRPSSETGTWALLVGAKGEGSGTTRRHQEVVSGFTKEIVTGMIGLR
jgi:hypothetical protein